MLLCDFATCFSWTLNSWDLHDNMIVPCLLSIKHHSSVATHQKPSHPVREKLKAPQ